MAEIILLLAAGDVRLGRIAWHSYLWCARMTEVLESKPEDFSAEEDASSDNYMAMRRFQPVS